MDFTSKRLFLIAKTFLIGLAGAVLFNLAHIPLPWMLGPLFCVGAAGIGGVKVVDLRGGRQGGQLVIGCALGLYFSPAVTRQVLDFGPFIVGAALAAILIGVAGSTLLRRLAGIDRATAFFASVPGGASEMAVLAERAGARFDLVALTHSIRVLMVATIIPLAVTFSGARGDELYTAASALVSPSGLAVLLAVALAAALVFARLRIPNAWLLGPLLASGVLTLSGTNPSALPPLLPAAAQLFIGCSLGTRFKPSLLRESRRLMLGILASNCCSIVLMAGLGLLVARLTEVRGATMVLATAPGGLAEMCITAKVLLLGVPLVTAYQVMRLALVVSFSLPTWRLLSRRGANHAATLETQEPSES